VKAAYGGEVVGENFGVSCLQLLDEELDVGGDEFLFGRILPQLRLHVLPLERKSYSKFYTPGDPRVD